MTQPAPRLAVVVTSKSAALMRRFLANYVKMPFGMQKNQWRKRYREEYALTVLATPLAAGQEPQDLYGAHTGAAALMLACYERDRSRVRAWLAENGYDNVAEMPLPSGLPECDYIDAGAEIVNFVNLRCPWRIEKVEDIDAYLELNNKPFWA
jgi:hypothetical protein